MRTLSIRELREALPSIDELVRDEGELIVTSHGRPLVKVVPLKPTLMAPSHAELRASMKRATVPSEELVRADRERG